MAEYIATAAQTVPSLSNVIFTDTVTSGPCSIYHRTDSGLINLRGITNQCRARFKVTFGANIAVSSSGTAGAISLAIATAGEAINSTTMTVTPSAVNQYFNVASSVFLDVPRGCCTNVSIQNVSDQEILVENANIIVERVA